jgi:hypothetical protein
MLRLSSLLQEWVPFTRTIAIVVRIHVVFILSHKTNRWIIAIYKGTNVLPCWSQSVPTKAANAYWRGNELAKKFISPCFANNVLSYQTTLMALNLKIFSFHCVGLTTQSFSPIGVSLLGCRQNRFKTQVRIYVIPFKTQVRNPFQVFFTVLAVAIVLICMCCYSICLH